MTILDASEAEWVEHLHSATLARKLLSEVPLILVCLLWMKLSTTSSRTPLLFWVPEPVFT